jgi:DNA-binding NarL/FixJ family response regulator
VSLRLLIVDAYAEFRSAARELLEADGGTVVGEAANGGSALAPVAALAPNVVLLDVAPPGHDASTSRSNSRSATPLRWWFNIEPPGRRLRRSAPGRGGARLHLWSHRPPDPASRL